MGTDPTNGDSNPAIKPTTISSAKIAASVSTNPKRSLAAIPGISDSPQGAYDLQPHRSEPRQKPAGQTNGQSRDETLPENGRRQEQRRQHPAERVRKQGNGQH